MRTRFSLLAVALAGTLALGGMGAALADAGHSHDKKLPKTATVQGHTPADVRLKMPVMNSKRGMKLFASKGCVACHAVNGVGGHDATALDAHTMDVVMNPFDFAAKMWRMAPAMIAAQEEAMEGQILFTGDELADIVAFIHDDRQQHKFTAAMIPPEVERLMHHQHGTKKPHQEEIGHDADEMKKMMKKENH